MRKGIIVLLILVVTIKGFTQDVNFLMYSNTTLNINPSIISSSDNLVISGSYLNESYMNDVENKSAYISLTRPLYKQNRRFGGFGFSILSNNTGNVEQISYEGISAAYAHEVQLTSWSRLSLGLQFGYLIKHIGTQEFTTGNQWIEGSGYDPTISNGEFFKDQSVGNFNLSSGLFWYIPDDNRLIKSYLGFSIYNLTKPNYSFFNLDNTEPFKYIVSLGHRLYQRNNLAIMPHLLYYNSYYQNNWQFGVKWSYRFEIENENRFLNSGDIDLVTDYHLEEGFIIGLQINQPKFAFGIGYGFSNNFSTDFSPNKGTIEISLSFKKPLYHPQPKQKIMSDAEYLKGQERKLAFKKDAKEHSQESEIVKKTEVNDVKKDIKKSSKKDIKFKLEKDFQFGFNEAGLNEEARNYLNDIVILLSENEMLKIEIIGHTDNVGTREANQYISEQRAFIVKQYLIEKGIDASRINTKGEADKFPINNNDTEDNRSRNRRVEFIIFY